MAERLVSNSSFTRPSSVGRLKRFWYPNVSSPYKLYQNTVCRFADEAIQVLDVGCGRTPKVLMNTPLARALKVGVDVVDEFLVPPDAGVRVVRADCGHLPFADACFDLLICRSVLEHLDVPSSAFQEFYRVLRPGGRFVFLTPNKFDYVSIGASLIPNRWHPRLVRRMTGRKEQDTFPTWFRANTTRSLRKTASFAGLEIEELTLVRQHPHYLGFSTGLYAIGIVYEQILARWIPQLRPWILGVLRRPAVEAEGRR